MALRKQRLANLKVGLDSEMVVVLTKMWGVQVHDTKVGKTDGSEPVDLTGVFLKVRRQHL